MENSAENTKTGIEKLLDGHLKGLILPENNNTNELSLWILLLVFTLILLSLYASWRWYKRRYTPQQKALRKLLQLHGYLGKSQNRQAIAIQLSSYLRQGLQAKRLELYQPEKRSQWRSFLRELETASYSSSPPTHAQLEALFQQSLKWLKHR